MAKGEFHEEGNPQGDFASSYELSMLFETARGLFQYRGLGELINDEDMQVYGAIDEAGQPYPVVNDPPSYKLEIEREELEEIVPGSAEELGLEGNLSIHYIPRHYVLDAENLQEGQSRLQEGEEPDLIVSSCRIEVPQAHGATWDVVSYRLTTQHTIIGHMAVGSTYYEKAGAYFRASDVTRQQAAALDRITTALWRRGNDNPGDEQ